MCVYIYIYAHTCIIMFRTLRKSMEQVWRVTPPTARGHANRIAQTSAAVLLMKQHATLVGRQCAPTHTKQCTPLVVIHETEIPLPRFAKGCSEIVVGEMLLTSPY